jgi:hypothetical protein
MGEGTGSTAVQDRILSPRPFLWERVRVRVFSFFEY